MVKDKIKKFLRKFGVLQVYYFFREEFIHRRYYPIKISYKGYDYTMFGIGGDFTKSVELYGCYEPLLIDKAIEIIKPGDVIFDIGCAEGYFSLFAAQLNRDSSRIYGFDNDENRSRIFRKNNRTLLGNQAELISLYVSDNMENEGTITVDYFIENRNIPAVSLIKIDVEGAEFAVIKGMLRCLKNYRPHLLIEMHPKFVKNFMKNAADLCESLKYINYKLELCSNHRGEYRGKVEPWREVNEQEFKNFCLNRITEGNLNNFAIHCYRK